MVSHADSVVAGLDLKRHLRHHSAGAVDLSSAGSDPVKDTELLCLPVVSGQSLEEVLHTWWPRLSPGAFIAVQSSATDPAGQQWLDDSRSSIEGYKYRSITVAEPNTQ